MRDFEYHAPRTLDAALSLIKSKEDGKIIAGGMTLLPALKQRLAAPSGLAGHVDELAAIPARDHVARDRLHHEQRPRHVHRKQLVIARPRDVHDGRKIKQRGIVHQNVDAPHLLHGQRHACVDADLIGHIQRNRLRPRPQRGGCSLGRPMVDIADHHLRPLAQIGPRKLQPDAARGPGDQRAFPL